MKTVPLRMVSHDKFIDINLIESSNPYVNAEFSQVIKIRTRKRSSLLSLMQKDMLTHAGFSQRDGYYQFSIKANSAVINKSRFNNKSPGNLDLNIKLGYVTPSERLSLVLAH